MDELDLQNIREGVFSNEQENEVVVSKSYFDRIPSRELISRLSEHSRCLDNLVIEMDFVPNYEPYNPDGYNETRTKNDVGMDIDYNLWEIQRVVNELCERFNIKVG